MGAARVGGRHAEGRMSHGATGQPTAESRREAGAKLLKGRERRAPAFAQALRRGRPAYAGALRRGRPPLPERLGAPGGAGVWKPRVHNGTERIIARTLSPSRSNTFGKI